MKKTLLAILIIALSPVSASWSAGQLEQIDTTNATPTPTAGEFLVDIVGIRWDTRSIPVNYRVNNTQNPVPNALGGASVLNVSQARSIFQASFDRWNRIPTSYINMRVVGETANTGNAGFDFVNELSFRTAPTFGSIAASPSISLTADTCFTDGEDINGDGKADVSARISTVQEIDGQNIFPVGCYKAGTILDNDVVFNTKTTNGYRFTTGDENLDTITRSVDLAVVATHEFGHSHGLSHSLNNNKSASNGRGATMFPFIDTGDPAAERVQRDLDSDDIASSSRVYPEGTASTGPAALTPGDLPFNLLFSRIRGKVTDGLGSSPVAGASVFAINRYSGELVSSTISGKARINFNPSTGGLNLTSPSDNIVNGDYELVVPWGVYDVGIEPVDGAPVPASSINFTTQIGAIFGQQAFNEEFWNRNLEFGLEYRPGEPLPVFAIGNGSSNINFTTNLSFNFNQFGNRVNVGFTDSAPGSWYIVRVPLKPIVDALGDDFLVQAALFDTFVADASVVPKFSEALIATGKVDTTGAITAINIDRPVIRKTNFIGADNDFAPLFLRHPRVTGRQLAKGFTNGEYDSVFLMLRLPKETPFPGASALPPLVGISNIAPVSGNSYVSDDGVNFQRVTTLDFRFSLSFSQAP
jgi:Matrixin